MARRRSSYEKKSGCVSGSVFRQCAFAGFKVKNVKAKKPKQFQTRTSIEGVTYAADLLLDGKEQKEFFYKELTPSDIVAVRLAVFNAGKEEIELPGNLQLLGPTAAKSLSSVPRWWPARCLRVWW